VLARYGYAEAWSSKITLGIFALSLLPLHRFSLRNLSRKQSIGRAPAVGPSGHADLTINARFSQHAASTILAGAGAGGMGRARLITFDLADNALPILLSHPISRFGYVLGKFIALFASLSLVTWFLCLCCLPIKVILPLSHGSPPILHRRRLAGRALIWIAFLSILGLALVFVGQVEVAATGIIFAAVFVPAGVGGIVSAVLRTRWGYLLNIPVMMTTASGQRCSGTPELIRPKSSLPNRPSRPCSFSPASSFWPC
jgi:hypothetical protein